MEVNMDEIEKYEIYMRGAFSMLNFIRETFNKAHNLNFVDEIDEKNFDSMRGRVETSIRFIS